MRSNPAQAIQIAALKAQLARSQNVIDNFGRFWHRAVPSVQALLGDKVRLIGRTSDDQGSIYATKDGLIKVTALPATQTFLIEGFGEETGIVPLEVKVDEKTAKLTELDALKIVATCAAIRAVSAGLPNPLALTELSVQGVAPVLADAPAARTLIG